MTGQSAFVAQPVQVPVATLHALFEPVHALWLLAEHWPQEPFGWQAGVAPPQLASVVQPTHVLVAGAQTGVVPLQFAFVRHPTHTAAATSQTGFAPVHAVRFEAEHWPQAPVG